MVSINDSLRKVLLNTVVKSFLATSASVSASSQSAIARMLSKAFPKATNTLFFWNSNGSLSKTPTPCPSQFIQAVIIYDCFPILLTIG
ncbi:hypothetical protein H1Q63_35505 [Desmonostoc muscorum CCALA 125]|nr:hypothetical protein [Desmonostoc muscorum CCALA 125]